VLTSFSSIILTCSNTRFHIETDTLKELRSSVRWTATERVQFATDCELIAETKVSKFDVLIAVEQEILCLQIYTIIRCNETFSSSQ